MRAHTLAPLMLLLAMSPAPAAENAPSAEDAITRLLDAPSELERNAWYDANVKGKFVAWVAPVFGVDLAFGSVYISLRPTERGLIQCDVTGKFAAAAKAARKGDMALCAGRVENYERMMGAALISVTPDSFVVGKDKIDAWQKAQKKNPP